MVYISPPDFSSTIKFVQTESDGSYVADGLESGSYVVWVRADGYGNLYYPGTYTSSNVTTVQVNAPNTTSGIDIQVSPEATVSGRVTNQKSGQPLVKRGSKYGLSLVARSYRMIPMETAVLQYAS